jgi:hypothetical protein
MAVVVKRMNTLTIVDLDRVIAGMGVETPDPALAHVSMKLPA